MFVKCNYFILHSRSIKINLEISEILWNFARKDSVYCSNFMRFGTCKTICLLVFVNCSDFIWQYRSIKINLEISEILWNFARKDSVYCSNFMRFGTCKTNSVIIDIYSIYLLYALTIIKINLEISEILWNFARKDSVYCSNFMRFGTCKTICLLVFVNCSDFIWQYRSIKINLE